MNKSLVMTIGIEEKTKAIDLLNNYEGRNPYLIKLKTDVLILKKSDLNDFKTEYILKNFNKQPKLIKKNVKIVDWYGEKLKEDWKIDFVPKVLEIKYLLGETDTTYHCLIKYRKNMDYIYTFLNKKGVMTDFTVEDYHDVQVDFDRYDRLQQSRRPDKIRFVKPHQKEAVQFLLSRKKCVLADDMGLGKSLSLSVAAIEGNFDCVLIICPASLKSNWFEELTYFVPEREISIIGGFTGMKKNELEKYLGYGIGKSNKTVSELQQEAKERGKWNENRFVIVNYDILDEFCKIPKSRKKVDIEEAEKNSPLLQFISNKKSLIIVDEAHNLSNMKSQQYKIINTLIRRGKPHSIYLSTGTPITNNPLNYFNLLSLIDVDITEDWQYYIEHYCEGFKMPINDEEKEKKKRITEQFIKSCKKNTWYDLTDAEKKQLNDELSRKVKFRWIPKGASNLDELKERTSHVYLRRTKEDFNELPEKHVLERIYLLTDEEKAEYDRLWGEYEREKLEENPDKELNKELLEGGLYRKYLSNRMVPHTIKFVDKCLAKNEKVVIVCCYDEELYTLRDYYKDICVIYNGKMSSKEKDKAKDEFINNPDIKVIIGNIDSIGVGLTLTVSRVLIFNNFSFVPGICRQAEDRIYRIGQQREVFIYYQFFKDTQYEKMWNTVLRKELTINQIIKKEDEK